MKIRTPPINPKIIATIPVLLSAGMVTGAIYYYGWWGLYLSPLILGILAGGLADLDNGITGRLKNILFSITAFALSSVAVQISFDEPVFLVSTFTILAFIFTMFGAAGNRYRTIAFATLVVAVYTALSHGNHLAWYINTGLMLAGALLHSLCSLLVHIIFPHRPVQESMAQAFNILANYLDNKADFFDPDEIDLLEAKQLELAMNDSKVIAAFTVCQNALFYRMRGQHRHPRTIKMLRYYFAAQDIHERISSSHVHYHAFAEQMKHTDLIFRIQRLLRLQALACQEFAGSLKNHTDYHYSPKLKRATLGAETALQYYANLPKQDNDIAPYRVQRLLDDIMHVSRQFNHLGNTNRLTENESSSVRTLKARLRSPETGGLKGAWQRLQRQTTLTSPVFRHAVRMAISVCTCCILVYVVPQIPTDILPLPTRNDNFLGYWILLTAIYVCQPNYSATKKRLTQRILGTIAGVMVGSGLILLKFSLEIKLVLIVVLLSLFFLFRTNKHSFSTFFITIQAILSFSIAGYDMNQFFLPRIVDTIVGATIAGVAVYFLWPDWKYISLDKVGNRAIENNSNYLKATIGELQKHNQIDSPDYRQARRAAQDSAASLSSTLSDMSDDVQKFAPRLKDGFLLLKINYSLISYISALSSLRQQIQYDDTSLFLSSFFKVSNQLVKLMRNVTTFSPDDFQAAVIALHNDLENLRPVVPEQHTILSGEHDNSAQYQVLWQQLMMIIELLQPCYDALQRINQLEHTN